MRTSLLDRLLALALVPILGPVVALLAWLVRRREGPPAFVGLARQAFTVGIHNSDATIDPVALAHDAAEAGLSAAPASSAVEALARIAQLAGGDERPPRILIGGSLYFAGNILEENGTPPD